MYKTVPVLRPELSPLPARMAELAVDDRGYPIPWFVAYVDGKPEFRGMDYPKFVRALKEKLCWVCGKRLGVHVTFVVGPMCGINRISSEPPSHHECGVWSAINCPFMNNPRQVRREDEVINNQSTREAMAGIGLMRNPGVTLLWNTRQFEVIKAPNGHLVVMGEPESVEYFCEGRTATRAEVLESVESGIPNLEAAAKQDNSMDALKQARARFEKWLPNAE